MADIPLLGTGGLFTRIGRIGRLILAADTYQAGIDTYTDDIFDEYDDVDRPQTAPALSASTVLKPIAVGGLATFQQLAIATIIKMAGDSNPPAGRSLVAAIQEVITQMRASGDTVQRCLPAITATASTGIVGTGGIVTTILQGDGLPLENMRAETARVTCTADGYQSTSITAGQETFGFFGGPATVQTFDYNFPGPSGATVGFSAVDPDSTGTLGTYISNGDFEDYATANTPDDWTIVAGSAGTQILEDTSVYYSGSSSLKFVGDAANTQIKQAITDFLPLTSYAVNLWVRTSGVPAAGVLTVDLYSPAATAVIADDQGTSNTFDTSLPGLTGATWTRIYGVFRTPRNSPTDTVIRVRLSTALSVGTNLNLDRMCVATVIVPYTRGPGIAVFSGATPFIATDGWSLAITNDQGGSTYGATFQTLFDRLFGMREQRLSLPSSYSPTISDGLITL